MTFEEGNPTSEGALPRELPGVAESHDVIYSDITQNNYNPGKTFIPMPLSV